MFCALRFSTYFLVYCIQCVLLWLYDRLYFGELIETVMRSVSPSFRVRANQLLFV